MTRQENGIDQLIKRIQNEAIDKANKEHDEIVRKAKRDAEEILDNARAQSEIILEEARAFVVNEKRKMTAELELSARDFALKLSERLKEQLFFPAIKESVRITVKEPSFLKEVLERLIVEYVKTNPCNLDVLVPKELKITLATYFAGAIFDSLDKKCDVRLIDEGGIEGFALLKRGEHYVWDFRVDTIAQELLRLVEPALRKYFTSSTRTATTETAKAAMA
jgi:V/A-type H+-transporting ATPase subunit E